MLILTLCHLLMGNSKAFAQKRNVNMNIYGQLSYWDIEECQCQFEPKSGHVNDPIFGPSLGIYILIRERLVIQSELGYFQNTRESSGVNDLYFHDFGTVYYHETKNRTNNFIIDSKFGIGIGIGKVRLSPEIGFALVYRKNQSSASTTSTFTNLETFSYNKLPDTLPSEVSLSISSNTASWPATSATLGLTSLIELYKNWSLRVHGTYFNSMNWFKDQSEKITFFHFGFAIGFQISSSMKSE